MFTRNLRIRRVWLDESLRTRRRKKNMLVDEVVKKVDAKVDVKLVYDIDWLSSYIATRTIFILCPKELQLYTTRILIPNQTELVHKINSNKYGSNYLSILVIGMPPLSWSAHALHLFLHRHRQSLVISNDRQLPPDLATSPSCCSIIDIIGYRQSSLSARQITSLTADSSLIDYPDLCPKKRCQHMPPNFGVWNH